MTYTATVTSKNQITLPSKLYKKLGLTKGSKITFIDEGKKITVTAQKSIIDNLANSIRIPNYLNNAIIKTAIEKGKSSYFKNKYGKTLP